MATVFLGDKSIVFRNVEKENLTTFMAHDFSSFSNLRKAVEVATHEAITIGIQTEVEQYFTEILGIPMIIACGGLVQASNQYLAIFRRGKWDFPKGKLEKNETFEECAIREVQEEVGINTVILQSYFDSTYHIYQDKKKGWVLKKSIWYTMKGDFTEALTPQTEEGITEVRYFFLKDLRTRFSLNGYRSLTPLIEKLSMI